jgi:hypothetical protein
MSISFLIASVLLSGLLASASSPAQRFVDVDTHGKLTYPADDRGNRVPDFSHAGYRGGNEPIPNRPATSAIVLERPVEENGVRKLVIGQSVENAVRRLCQQPADATGYRGTLLLSPGMHVVTGPIRVTASGVVIRGSGPETVLFARGTDRRAVIAVAGRGEPERGSAVKIADAYVPVGATSFSVESAEPFRVGQSIEILHSSPKAWIAAVEMDRFPSRDKGSYLDWKPGTLDQRVERVVAKIDGNSITIDAPLPVSLDATLAECTVSTLSWPKRIHEVGIENLTIESEYDAKNPHDENHAWTGISFERCRDGWVRNVSFRHLAGSAVAVWQSASRITIRDCDSAEPISEIGGERRETFLTCGQQTLFFKCKSSHGRHDFATGHLAIGPNAYVQCTADHAHGDSGGIGSWATGTLYDNVKIDGGGLVLTNWETDKNGTGWATANSMLWQCTAPKIVCRNPPTARNWAIGVWGQLAGNGHWRQFNEFVKPDSLYAAQLKQRLGERAEAVLKSDTISLDRTQIKPLPDTDDIVIAPFVNKSMWINNGTIYMGDRPARGTRLGTAWWRGTTLPSRATDVGVGITRFVPGRTGPGYIDDLDDLTTEMTEKNQIVLEHHWGLWNDRRRDDHQMVRRSDGEVWAPFYELPWARSGKGKAWDGLSHYDLTKFNPWYFARLREFASYGHRKGIVLVNQMYFQHNVLEAAAHWADFPWRPANCLQATGFPEPPEYVGGKRIFMAEAFYDITHPLRRELHQAYIRHCLDELGDQPNVVFQIGEEFTGPASFVRFWLETIRDWQSKNHTRVTVSLSVPYDVQQAILADPKLRSLISIVNVKYWWHTADGKRYDPPASTVHAPRQQLREWKGSKTKSPESIRQSVREIKAKYPTMAVTVSLDGVADWIVNDSPGRSP